MPNRRCTHSIKIKIKCSVIPRNLPRISNNRKHFLFYSKGSGCSVLEFSSGIGSSLWFRFSRIVTPLTHDTDYYAIFNRFISTTINRKKKKEHERYFDNKFVSVRRARPRRDPIEKYATRPGSYIWNRIIYKTVRFHIRTWRFVWRLHYRSIITTLFSLVTSSRHPVVESISIRHSVPLKSKSKSGTNHIAIEMFGFVKSI